MEILKIPNYSPYFAENGYIFTCNETNGNVADYHYYFKSIDVLSVEEMRYLLQMNVRLNSYDKWMKLTYAKTTHEINDKKITQTSIYRGQIQDRNHDVFFHIFTGLITKKTIKQWETNYTKVHTFITQNEDDSIKACNDKTNTRDSIWLGVMPAGSKYRESQRSTVALDHCSASQALTDLMNGVIGETRQIMRWKNTEKITALQLIHYVNSWKTVHFDGRR